MAKLTVDVQLKQINFLDERFYLAGNDASGNPVYYPSVTHVLELYPKGAGYTQWLKDVGNNAKYVMERAMDSGSRVHDAIDILNKGNSVFWDEKVYSLEEWMGIMRYEDFYREHDVEVIASEINVYSHKMMYAGTADVVCRIKDESWLIDCKFGNAVYDSYFLQVIAYKDAFEEMNPAYKIDRVGVLHLKAGTRTAGKGDVIQGDGWKLIDPADDTRMKQISKKRDMPVYDILRKQFLNLLDLYYFENPDTRPKNEIYPTEITLKYDEDE
jgi:hypothetical protein